MPKLLPRIAAALAALPLAATLGTAPAAADTTVPGCFGVAVVVCDVTVEWGLPAGVGTYETQVPICAGSCTYVPVTFVGTAPGEPLQACVSYRTLSGSVVRHCAVGGGGTDPGGIVGIPDPSSPIRDIRENLDPGATIEAVRERLDGALAPVFEYLENVDLQDIIGRLPACSAC